MKAVSDAASMNEETPRRRRGKNMKSLTRGGFAPNISGKKRFEGENNADAIKLCYTFQFKFNLIFIGAGSC